MCRESKFAFCLIMKTWKKFESRILLSKIAVLPKSHIAFQSFLYLVQIFGVRLCAQFGTKVRMNHYKVV